MQFTPYSVDAFSWQFMASPLRMLECLLPVVIFLLFEVNAFFLKFILWVPPRNMLNSYRLLILFLGAIPAVKVWRWCLSVKHPWTRGGRLVVGGSGSRLLLEGGPHQSFHTCFHANFHCIGILPVYKRGARPICKAGGICVGCSRDGGVGNANLHQAWPRPVYGAMAQSRVDILGRGWECVCCVDGGVECAILHSCAPTRQGEGQTGISELCIRAPTFVM